MKMNNINVKLIAITLIGACLFAACDDDKETELEDPQIEITSPTAHAMIALNDTVWMTGNLTHHHGMHEYKITLNNVSQDSVVYDSTVEIHDMKDVDFEHFWINSVSDHSDMKLTVTASDHDSRVGTAEREFHCHPM
jgi:hypothetical protein